METLLEKAKAVKKVNYMKTFSPEIIELAIAWASGEVSFKQAATALGYYSSGTGVGNIPYLLARALRFAVESGQYKIIKTTTDET